MGAPPGTAPAGSISHKISPKQTIFFVSGIAIVFEVYAICLMQDQRMFDLLQRFTFCFRHYLPHKNQLDAHHDTEEKKSIAATGFFSEIRKGKCNCRRHYPMGSASQCLAFGPYLV